MMQNDLLIRDLILMLGTSSALFILSRIIIPCIYCVVKSPVMKCGNKARSLEIRYVIHLFVNYIIEH